MKFIDVLTINLNGKYLIYNINLQNFLQQDFGTLDYYTGVATACTAGQVFVNIPVQEVFWDLPIVSGAPSTAGYVITVPGGVTAPNFVIDLYQIQHKCIHQR